MTILPTTAPHGVRPLLDTRAAAKLLGLAPITLCKWRLTGKGPKFCKLGRKVGYLAEDINSWLAENRRTSTSERAPREPAAGLHASRP
jgi:predicted DNA-binding transcriptional regulator AlpA